MHFAKTLGEHGVAMYSISSRLVIRRPGGESLERHARLVADALHCLARAARFAGQRPAGQSGERLKALPYQLHSLRAPDAGDEAQVDVFSAPVAARLQQMSQCAPGMSPSGAWTMTSAPEAIAVSVTANRSSVSALSTERSTTVSPFARSDATYAFTCSSPRARSIWRNLEFQTGLPRSPRATARSSAVRWRQAR